MSSLERPSASKRAFKKSKSLDDLDCSVSTVGVCLFYFTVLIVSMVMLNIQYLCIINV